MATSIAGSVKVTLDSVFSNSLDLSSISDSMASGNLRQITQAFSNGTGANKAQVHWHDERSILTTENDDLDLTNVVGAFGAESFAKIKYMIIYIATLDPGYRLEMGNAGANEWAGTSQLLKAAGDLMRLEAGGMYILTAPINGFVVDATHKVLRLNNPSGGTVTYRIWLCGEGAVS